jgi:hypothetical protein
LLSGVQVTANKINFWEVDADAGISSHLSLENPYMSKMAIQISALASEI